MEKETKKKSERQESSNLTNRKDLVGSLGTSFDLPKLEMLNTFNNDRPIPTIDQDLRDQINEPISQSNRLSSNNFTPNKF